MRRPDGDDPDVLDDDEENDEEAGVLPEFLRRGLTMGFTGFFMGEEALRKALGDTVPRDWLDFWVNQSEKTRQELVDRMSHEFGRVLTALDPVEVARRLLDGQTVEVSAKIRLASSDKKKKRTRSDEDDEE